MESDSFEAKAKVLLARPTEEEECVDDIAELLASIKQKYSMYFPEPEINTESAGEVAEIARAIAAENNVLEFSAAEEVITVDLEPEPRTASDILLDFFGDLKKLVAEYTEIVVEQKKRKEHNDKKISTTV